MDKVKRRPKNELSRPQGAVIGAVFVIVATVGIAFLMIATSYVG